MPHSLLRLNANITKVKEEGAFAVSDRAAQLSAQGHDIINLGIGQPDFSPPMHILQAAQKAAIDGPHGYTSPTGLPILKQAVATNLNQRYKTSIHSDQIIIVPGGKVTIFFAAMLMGGPDSEILYPDPGFPPYLEAIISSGAKPVAYQITEHLDFSFKAQDVLSLITDKTSLIILNSPANPTGGVVPRSELKKLSDGLEKFPHVSILSDEIYGQLIFNKSDFTSMLEFKNLRDRTIILDGWSKTFAMTGWRLGYGVWPLHLVEHVRKLITVDHSCVNGVAQMAGLAAINGPMDEINHFVDSFHQRRNLIVKGLNDIPNISCQMPKGAFYAFPNIKKTGISSQKLAHNLLEQAHIATISGNAFGQNGNGYLRISYAASQESLTNALSRIKQFLI